MMLLIASYLSTDSRDFVFQGEISVIDYTDKRNIFVNHKPFLRRIASGIVNAI